MSYSRRRFVSFLASAGAVSIAPQIACAEPYPSRPIRMVVGFPAGNAPDMVARLTGQQLAPQLGQPVIVENRVGAASIIAARMVATAKPDGYTLLLITPANAINPDLSGGLNFVRDIMPIAGVARGPFVLVVKEASPFTTAVDFLREARANPNKIIIGTPGARSAPNLAAVLLKMMTGITTLVVPFEGSSQAVTELLAGRVQAALVDMSANALIRSGAIRALAVTTATPQEVLPGVPAMSQFAPGYEAATWYGIGAPRGTPDDIINRLNEAIRAGLNDDTIKMRLATFGIQLELSTAAHFGKQIKDETEKWAKVLKFGNSDKQD